MREESRGGRNDAGFLMKEESRGILRGRSLKEAGFCMREESRGGRILNEAGVLMRGSLEKAGV